MKVDVDTLLLADRLRAKLKVLPSDAAMYFQNCERLHSMQGSVEILTRAAALRFFNPASLEQCERDPLIREGAEDKWLSHCLDVLGVWSVGDYDLVFDQRCHADDPLLGQCRRSLPAFHPLATVQ